MTEVVDEEPKKILLRIWQSNITSQPLEFKLRQERIKIFPYFHLVCMREIASTAKIPAMLVAVPVGQGHLIHWSLLSSYCWWTDRFEIQVFMWWYLCDVHKMVTCEVWEKSPFTMWCSCSPSLCSALFTCHSVLGFQLLDLWIIAIEIKLKWLFSYLRAN